MIGLRVAAGPQLFANVAPIIRGGLCGVEARIPGSLSAGNWVFPVRQINTTILSRDRIAETVVARERHIDQDCFGVTPIAPIARCQPLWRKRVEAVERPALVVSLHSRRTKLMRDGVGKSLQRREDYWSDPYCPSEVLSVDTSRVDDLNHETCSVSLSYHATNYSAHRSDKLLSHQVGLRGGSISGPANLDQAIGRDSPLFKGVRLRVANLTIQQGDLLFSGIRGSTVREIGSDSTQRSEASEEQRPYLQDVRETRLRALLGVPLLLLGIWLVFYCDRSFNGNLGWQGWTLWFTAGVCFIASFILLLFSGSLSSLKELW